MGDSAFIRRHITYNPMNLYSQGVRWTFLEVIYDFPLHSSRGQYVYSSGAKINDTAQKSRDAIIPSRWQYRATIVSFVRRWVGSQISDLQSQRIQKAISTRVV